MIGPGSHYNKATKGPRLKEIQSLLLIVYYETTSNIACLLMRLPAAAHSLKMIL